MKTVEIVGYKRANLGKAEAKRLRLEASVPSVLYGGKEQVHFHAPMILFRPLVYTPDAAFVALNIEGEEYKAILQDVQFHPVSEVILHADFLLISDDKKLKMDIPVQLEGQAPGVTKGGTLIRKRRTLQIEAFPPDMPDVIVVDISDLDFHHAKKVGDLPAAGYSIMDPVIASIAVVEMPRALRGLGDTDEEGEETEGEAAAEGAETEEGASE